ncbi:MAG: hypothetical protein ABI700_21260 [Chloroflexota bacterium]
MMKHYLRAGLIAFLLCIATGLVFAQDATEQPSTARPALVPCVDGDNTPCVQNVEQASDLVGTWRSYIRDSSGLHLGFTVYKTDGSIAITSDPQTAPTGIGTITFANEIATLTTSSTDTTNCVNPGSYEIRLIRMGNQPVALTYHALNQATNDICFGRVGGFSQAMLYYPGTGKDLTTLDPKTDALAQPLVPCLGLPRPCDVIATNLSDIKGLWKAYFSPLPQGFGFQRIDEGGDMMLAGDGTDLSALKEVFPQSAPRIFNGALLLEGNPDPTDTCATNVAYLRVIKFGNQMVALQWTPIQDTCPPRQVDFSDVLIWVKGL